MIGNVAEARRVFGVSRKTYYQWLGKAERYGLSALLPRQRRTPHQPNAMSSEELTVILSEALARPTLGPRSLLRQLRFRGVARSASGWPRCLLGTARGRTAARRGAGEPGPGRDRAHHPPGDGRPVRVLPVRGRAGAGGRLGHRLRRPAQRDRGGLAAYRGRRRDPDRGTAADRRLSAHSGKRRAVAERLWSEPVPLTRDEAAAILHR